jgi:hydroxymethylbilane synthase
MKIIIGTRGSKLALAQTEKVRDTLEKAYPEYRFEIKIITTKGDRITNRPLAEIGGKGLFVREIEEQLKSGEIQLGVHSMKDMPAAPAPGLVFTKAWKREDSRDVVILREKSSLAELPEGAVIGTGSVRRKVQLQKLRPDIQVVDIRGNVDTRLRKMEEQKLDGIVLAAAGLHRLGLHEKITRYLSYEEMLPSPAQGTLALEIRQDNEKLRQLLDALADEESEKTTGAEREFLALCGGDCHMPIAAVCEKLSAKSYRLRGMFGGREGTRLVFADVTGNDVKKLAAQAAERVMS